MINRVVIVGRITKTPELKTIDNLCFTTFHIAVNNFRSASGQQKTSFIPVTAWNNQATNICKYVTKGMLLGVDGSLVQKKFTSKDGRVIEAIEIVAKSVDFLSSKNQEISGNSETINENNDININENNKNNEDIEYNENDEMPF